MYTAHANIKLFLFYPSLTNALAVGQPSYILKFSIFTFLLLLGIPWGSELSGFVMMFVL